VLSMVRYTRERLDEFGACLDARVRDILAQGGNGATLDITGNNKPSMQIASDYYYPKRRNR
jgi:hypothetical protein